MYPAHHDFLHQRVRTVYGNPAQERWHREAPMPCGVVFLPWPGLTEDEARQHFRWMKELGFTCLKQTMPTPEWPEERTYTVALDEGIMPWWYAEGGWDPMTPELLTRLGLPADLGPDQARTEPRMLAHQTAVMRARIISGRSGGRPQMTGHAEGAAHKDWVPGMVGKVNGHELDAAALPGFASWLEARYGTIEALRAAWNDGHVGITLPATLRSFADIPASYPAIASREYRHLVDALTFRSETFVRQHVAPGREALLATDPHVPARAGGEMGVFLSFAARGTDMEAIAREVAKSGSFYPSIHLAWHFEEVGFEVARPVYLQSAMAADWAKGTWSATWESTGGPQYFSGGKSPFVKDTQDAIPGFTTDAGVMTTLVLSYIAAGFRGFGMWAWNYRTAGWEGGEYSMLGRNLKPNARAKAVGRIAKAMQRHRREIWDGVKEPLVGVLANWENEAMWAAMAVTGRDRYKAEPIRARIGLGRILVDGNIPWEHVTQRDLRHGLAARYPVIVLSAQLSIASDLWPILEDYVAQGGRLVMDMPSAYYDDHGRITRTDAGTPFERIFGCVLDEYSYSTRLQRQVSVDGVRIEGFTAEITPTTGAVAARFSHDRPAVIEHRRGAGSACVLAFQVGMTTWRPGHADLQALALRHILGRYESPYRCQGAIAYRLAGPAADHYILINASEPGDARLDPWAFTYTGAEDAVTGEALDLTRPIPVDGWSGRWIRCRKG
jgi:beta-galactosidase